MLYMENGMKKTKRFLCLAVLVLSFFGISTLQATSGSVVQITHRTSELRFWLDSCASGDYFKVASTSNIHDQVKLLIWAAQFSGRKVTTPSACGVGVAITQVDLIAY